MLRAFKVISLVALLAVVALVGVVAGCGSSSDTTSSPSASASADTTRALKIGITQIVSHPALDAAVEGFKAALAEKGYTNITYDMQNAEGDMATTASIAQKFAADSLDLILGVATPTTQAVVKADKTTPIVFTAVTDPGRRRARHRSRGPEANVTGVSDLQPVEPILELAKQFNPDAKSVGIVYNAGESNSVYIVEAGQEGRRHHGSRDRRSDGQQLLRGAGRGQVAGRARRRHRRHRRQYGGHRPRGDRQGLQREQDPLLAGDTDSVKRGAAAGYGFDYMDLGKQAGYQAAMILGGTPIKDIPVEYAEEPAALDQREGCHGPGRHDSGGPGRHGRQQVLSVAAPAIVAGAID